MDSRRRPIRTCRSLAARWGCSATIWGAASKAGLPHADADIALPDMAVGIYDWALIVDHQQREVSLLSYDDPHARLRWKTAQAAPAAAPFSLTSAWRSNMSREQYGEKFCQVQAWLQSGDCYQVNLAQRFQARYQGDEWQAFCQLNRANRAPFSAFIRLEDGAVTLSGAFYPAPSGEIQNPAD